MILNRAASLRLQYGEHFIGRNISVQSKLITSNPHVDAYKTPKGLQHQSYVTTIHHRQESRRRVQTETSPDYALSTPSSRHLSTSTSMTDSGNTAATDRLASVLSSGHQKRPQTSRYISPCQLPIRYVATTVNAGAMRLVAWNSLIHCLAR